MNKQKIEIIGRVVVKPKLQKSKGDKDYTKIRVAVNKKQKDEEGKENNIVTYYDVLTFGKRAEKLSKLKKGTLVCTTGDIEITPYLTKDGNPKADLTIFTDQFLILNTKIFK